MKLLDRLRELASPIPQHDLKVLERIEREMVVIHTLSHEILAELEQNGH